MSASPPVPPVPPRSCSLRAVRRVGWAAALAFLAASCAPQHPRPTGLDVATIGARYERARAARETRAAAVRMDATLWVEGDRVGRWPAFDLDLALVGPNAMRARVASLFGTALDMTVRGDTLRAYVPPKRIGIETGALEESLGVREPGAWGCRVFSAGWQPRDVRWSAPSSDTLWWARWAEGQDSLAMGVASDGTPRRVRLEDSVGRAIEVRYPDWKWEQGVQWPEQVEVQDGAGEWHVTCRIERVQFADQPDPRWLSLTLPDRARRVDWSDLRRALTRLGEVR